LAAVPAQASAKLPDEGTKGRNHARVTAAVPDSKADRCRFSDVTPELLHERGLIKKAKHDLVILGNGDISKSLTISAHRFTKTAKEKIEKAGGSANAITKEQAAA
jgi:ribosomal protein L15